MIRETDAVDGWVLQGPRKSDLIREETLADIFAASVLSCPDKPALSLLGSDDSLSYLDVQVRARRVAAGLTKLGVVRGDIVGLWFRRGIDLHVALLGIIEAGAAYLPFDADAPAERVARCLADCGARLLLTEPNHFGAAGQSGLEAVGIDSLLNHPEPAQSAPSRPDDPAYVIYTSGSTGEPKGIVVSHRNVCHYVRSINETLGIDGDDVVLQQASVAFDLSIEEIFVPYSVGATIKVVTDAALRDVDTLVDKLEQDGVTVLDTVPTLLAMLERRPATVRLVVTGGEACPSNLIERYTEGSCRFVNTYGPTETTVVATAADLLPGEPVTIGGPITNYTAYVVDEALRPISRGEVGELLIGGPGVTRGYLGRPDLTAVKFVANPHAALAEREPVVYRTGDAVSIDDEDRLVFHGRIDLQVKIRGFRIELAEIEALICREPLVRVAVVTASRHGATGEVLVAHIVTDEGFDAAEIKRSLAAKLPPYMLPSLWRAHDELPVLSSGKIDRKTLAALPTAETIGTGEQETPASVTEAHLLKAARDVLGLTTIDLEADFFLDLGGHSLLAARFVSEIRKVPRLAGVALQDVYSARSMRALARRLDARLREGSGERQDLSFEPPPLARRFLCGLAQAIALPFIIAIVTAQWIGLLLASIYLVRDDSPFWIEASILCGIYIGLNLGAKLAVIGLKWLVIGRTRPGVYPLWGTYYFRIWLMQRLVHLTAHKFLQGSPLMRLYLRALGAKIGHDAIVNEFEEGAIDLVEIGPRSSIGSKVRFANVEVIGNEVHVGTIRIGADAYIGNACVLGRNTLMGDGAELGDLTSLAAGARIAAGESWDGAPARAVGMVTAGGPAHPKIGPVRRAARTARYFIAYNFVMMIGLLPIFPAFYVLAHLDALTFGDRDNIVPWHFVLLLAWPAALGLVFASMLVVIVMRWVLMPRRVQPGRHSIYSGFYFRKWMVGLATESMLETLNSLYATVFMRNWYRLMGTKVGRGTEISANFSGRYDLIRLGENNFIGDEVIFGDEEVRNGWMTLERVETADRCFFGNLAVVPMGAKLEDDAMIGVKSRLPEDLHVKAGETWFGSPAISIPNRQRVQLSAHATYQPSRRMRLWRTCFEALHTSFPTAVLISLAYITADVIEFPINTGNWSLAFAIFFVAGLGVSSVMMAVSVAFKWLVVGVYKPLQKPMWSWWAMRTEAVSVLYGGLASKVMLDYTRGTPFMPWLLRLYGMKIGRGVWINCADVTEFDCISVGDFSVINMLASPQTHLYEDRVMKVGRIEIGRGVTLGTGAVVLYDTKIGDYARLEPLTVVMKGEHIPPHSVWTGAPSQRVTAPVCTQVVLPNSLAVSETRAASVA